MSANASLIVVRKRRAERRSDRETSKPRGGNTPRGSGDHQPSTSCPGPSSARTGIGNIPLTYASSSVSGSRSAPIPTTPSGVAALGEGNVHEEPETARGIDINVANLEPQ